MTKKQEDPGALAGADRAVKLLAGKNDIETSTPTTLDLQLRKVLRHYAISLDLALVIASIAFSDGRQT